MSCKVDLLLPVKLEKICYFGLWPENTVGQSVCRMFYFWLVWLVKLNTGGPLLHCTFFFVFLICFLVFFVFDIRRFIKPFTNYFNFFSPRHASAQSVFCGERIGEMLQLNLCFYYIWQRTGDISSRDFTKLKSVRSVQC